MFSKQISYPKKSENENNNSTHVVEKDISEKDASEIMREFYIANVNKNPQIFDF